MVNQDGKIDVQYGDDVLILHPMKVIALDRINMQIEYEKLRESLAGASLKMNEGLANISGQKVDEPYTCLTTGTDCRHCWL